MWKPGQLVTIRRNKYRISKKYKNPIQACDECAFSEKGWVTSLSGSSYWSRTCTHECLKHKQNECKFLIPIGCFFIKIKPKSAQVKLWKVFNVNQ